MTNTFPQGELGTCGTPDAFGWSDLIYPYVKNEKVFDCPSATTQRMTRNTDVNPPRFWRDRGGTGAAAQQDCITGQPVGNRNYNYGVSSFEAPQGMSAVFRSPFRTLTSFAEIPSPAEVAGIADGFGTSPWAMSGGRGPYDPGTIVGQADGRRHTGAGASNTNINEQSCNIMYMDGHAKWTSLARSIKSPGNIWTMADTD